MEEKDPNLAFESQVECPHCKAKNTVKVLQVNNCETINCTSCKKEIDLTVFNDEHEKNQRKNQKELEKLKKLLSGK